MYFSKKYLFSLGRREGESVKKGLSNMFKEWNVFPKFSKELKMICKRH